LTAVSSVLISQQWWIRLLGGLFLCYLGIIAFRSAPAGEAPGTRTRGLLLNFGSTFLLTIANPMTILSFFAVFAGLGVASAGAGYPESAMLVMGVFLGSALWWFS
jgi:threonine/homoserine/homoserine lactone efflux protein